MGYTYDTGMLLAVERGQRLASGLHRRALDRGVTITVPAPVLAQAWRGGPQATLSRALRGCTVAVLDEDRGLRDALLAGLAHELRRVTGHVEELHFLDLAGRLAMRLSRLAADAAPGADQVRLDWSYTQSDLASMIGGTRQSVNKLLSELVADGLVVLEPDAVVIPSVRALVRSAEH